MKDAPSDDLLYEVKGATGVVTFNRPAAHNALTFGMYDRLGEICASYTGNRRNAADALLRPTPQAPAPSAQPWDCGQ